jgi:radical SAM/Cys-rich protein
MLDTFPRLKEISFPAISRKSVDTLQLNLGYLCNQQCQHCHVNAGPNRTEQMSFAVLQHVLNFVDNNDIRTVDLTGGAPEMNPHFSFLIKQLRQRNVRVIDRCNLTILGESGYADLAQTLADNQVEIVASMPCYLEENVNRQRGKGVFEKSIKALQELNYLGYGKVGSGLVLNLVFNPQGVQLPPEQETLQGDYKRYLEEQFSVKFNHLLTITNVPIKRYGSMLLSNNEFESYMGLLQESFNTSNLEEVMCRRLISVDWQGYIYDCDFNQMLDLSLQQGGHKLYIGDVTLKQLENRDIIVAGHCYACTAGHGSSCGGALT